MVTQLRSAKGRLLWFIFLLIAFPVINQSFDIIHSAPLKRLEISRKPTPSWKGLWDGSYQEGLANYCNDAVGFRPDMIRVVNQINFSLFNHMNSVGATVGRHNDLFWGNYIESYCGKDYKGDNYPEESLWKLKRIQDTLERMGKMFVLVHSGSKASYFPEDIPGDVNCRGDGKTNLKNYVRIADSLGIHQINFNSWFASLHGKKAHPLFNKQGIHWNLYGAYFAADSLISYIEQAKKIRMPHPHIVRIEQSYKARHDEDDIESLLNLVFHIDTTAYWYPEIQYDDSAGRTKPKVIYIGDSFISPLLTDGLFNSNTDPEYWFYFGTAIFKNWEDMASRKEMDKYDWPGALKKTDCVVVMYTITGLVDASPTFINKAYGYYYPGK